MDKRLQKLLVAENLTPAKFADKLGVQRSAISHILSGRNKPSFDLLAKISDRFPRVSLEWLITGKGEVFKHPVQRSIFDSDTTVPVGSKSDGSTKTEKEMCDVTGAPKSLSEVQAGDVTNVTKRTGRSVSRVLVLYSDGTFDAYTPE